MARNSARKKRESLLPVTNRNDSNPPLPDATQDPQQTSTINQLLTRRNIAFLIGQVFVIVSFFLFRDSLLFNCLHLGKYLKDWYLVGMFVGQLVFVFVTVCCGPWKTEVIEWPCGYILKAVLEVATCFGGLKFVEMLTEKRRCVLRNSHKTHNDLIDLQIVSMTMLFGAYSVLVSYLLQPGIDYTLVGLLMDMLLHIAAKWAGAQHEWFPYFCVAYAFTLLVIKNGNEARARHKVHADEHEEKVQGHTSDSDATTSSGPSGSNPSLRTPPSTKSKPPNTPPSSKSKSKHTQNTPPSSKVNPKNTPPSTKGKEKIK